MINSLRCRSQAVVLVLVLLMLSLLESQCRDGALVFRGTNVLKFYRAHLKDFLAVVLDHCAYPFSSMVRDCIGWS